MSLVYRFTISGAPVIQERPRRGKHGNFYDPSSKAKKTLGMALLNARQRAKQAILGGSLSLGATFYVCGRKRCDIDNMLKALFDAGNGILWQDDAQIEEALARKVLETDPERSRTEVEITVL